jgi:hypothetical protein
MKTERHCPVCDSLIGVPYYCMHAIGKYRVYYNRYGYKTNVYSFDGHRLVFQLTKLMFLDEERIEKLLLLK